MSRVDRKGEAVPPRPPQEKVCVGGGDFDKIGRQWVEYFADECGLRPSDSVLDVGSGIGRVAIPLTEYLTGRYEGLEVVSDGVEWCRENITAPNFTFTLADIYHRKYHPEGKTRSTDFVFPYEDQSFDFAFLTSVFTHLLPDEVMHYASEIARVLKPGGGVAMSVFLLNDETAARLGRDETKFRFDYEHDGYRSNQPDPEEGLAYEEDWLIGVLGANGLEPVRIDLGGWSNPSEPSANKDSQDVIVARKP